MCYKGLAFFNKDGIHQYICMLFLAVSSIKRQNKQQTDNDPDMSKNFRSDKVLLFLYCKKNTRDQIDESASAETSSELKVKPSLFPVLSLDDSICELI